MDFRAAREQLERARAAAPAAVATAVDVVGTAAVERLRDESPRDSGEFADGWSWENGVLGNPAPYASFLPDQVPEVLEDLAPTFATTIERELDAAVGWK